MSFADVEQELSALEASGARSFDLEGCDLVRTLIARGATLPEPAGALLLERARVHLVRLGERFETARADTTERLERAEQIHGPSPEGRAALERGELRTLRRALRRLDCAPSLPRVIPKRVREREQRCAGDYETALVELSAQFTVARAVDEVPVHAGPYNSLRIATDLLARIGAVSPTYLAVQLKRLDELAVMLTLPEPPPAARPTTPTKAPPRKSRARPKRRSRSS